MYLYFMPMASQGSDLHNNEVSFTKFKRGSVNLYIFQFLFRQTIKAKQLVCSRSAERFCVVVMGTTHKHRRL